ncbi:hypothetical protein MKW98_030327 [Papaver atlanticum]|uniref:Uncharacterized protein n=1 Tax=Papaver atlanticum TaxID=357466 RepID=A0AAD4XXT3_9MAGN|nr:hypothetical protein MKW98_030327 [Papaver atlanticum]
MLPVPKLLEENITFHKKKTILIDKLQYNFHRGETFPPDTGERSNSGIIAEEDLAAALFRWSSWNCSLHCCTYDRVKKKKRVKREITDSGTFGCFRDNKLFLTSVSCMEKSDWIKFEVRSF